MNKFLSKILSIVKSEVNEKISDAVKPQNVHSDIETVKPTPVVKPQTVLLSVDELKRRIKEALDSIEGITYREDVSAKEIDASAHPAAKPVAFIVSKDDVPVLAIAVVANNTYRSMPVKGTQMLLEEKNIKYIRFFVECENNPGYVSVRIRENL